MLCLRACWLLRGVTAVWCSWEYTSQIVLTMEWIDGVKLTNKPAMDAAGQKIVDFVDIGIECTLRQLLEHGYFHAGKVSPAVNVHAYSLGMCENLGFMHVSGSLHRNEKDLHT